jgi:hypothetical protein
VINALTLARFDGCDIFGKALTRDIGKLFSRRAIPVVN